MNKVLSFAFFAIVFASCGEEKKDNSALIKSLKDKKTRLENENESLKDSVEKYSDKNIEGLPSDQKSAAIIKWGYYSKEKVQNERDLTVIQQQIDSLK